MYFIMARLSCACPCPFIILALTPLWLVGTHLSDDLQTGPLRIIDKVQGAAKGAKRECSRMNCSYTLDISYKSVGMQAAR